MHHIVSVSHYGSINEISGNQLINEFAKLFYSVLLLSLWENVPQAKTVNHTWQIENLATPTFANK